MTSTPWTRRQPEPPPVNARSSSLNQPAAVSSGLAMGRRFSAHVRSEARQSGIALVPVRVFIGIGWLRAAAEKAVAPNWLHGTGVSNFLNTQLAGRHIAFPPYQALVTGVFLPHAAFLGGIILLGQLLVGLAILTGTLTRAALVGGLFMNLNFVLSGAPDHSAFYIVIQAMLLLGGAGFVLGVDAHLPQRLRSGFPMTRPKREETRRPLSRSSAAALAAFALGCSAYAMGHIRDWTPGGSVHDSVAILAVLAAMVSAWSVIAYLRGDAAEPVRPSDPAGRQGTSRAQPYWSPSAMGPRGAVDRIGAIDFER